MHDSPRLLRQSSRPAGRQHTWMRGTPVRLRVPGAGSNAGRCGHNLWDRDNPQPSWRPSRRASRSNARKGVGSESLRYGLRPPGTVRPPTGVCRDGAGDRVNSRSGSTELACGSQAFIATLLFDPSMSALPIIPKQNSVSVGLFTH
jgi:hypothetical protein